MRERAEAPPPPKKKAVDVFVKLKVWLLKLFVKSKR